MELFSEESLRKAIFHAKEGGSRWHQVGSLQEGRPSVRPSSKLCSTPIVPAADAAYAYVLRAELVENARQVA